MEATRKRSLGSCSRSFICHAKVRRFSAAKENVVRLDSTTHTSANHLNPGLIKLRSSKTLRESAALPKHNYTHIQKQQTECVSIKKEDLERVATLGIGGFGRVELVVWSKDRSKSFALKQLKKEYVVHTKQQIHVCSERELMLKLNSPFICRMYCTYKDTKFVYMLMEACLGGELWTVLRNCGPFEDDLARFTSACVVEAFTYLHGQSIVFRDLKPENLLMDNNGYVKLCDFGLAKLCNRAWTVCGTPAYMAPEIIARKGYDYSVDYWSLGILVFELLTGSPPYNCSEPMNMVTAVHQGIVYNTHYIGPSAARLITRLCAYEPAERLGYGVGGADEIQFDNPPYNCSEPMNMVTAVHQGIGYNTHYIGPSAARLITRLCAYEPAECLGYGVGRTDEIKHDK